MHSETAKTRVVTNQMTMRIVDRLRHRPMGFNELDRAVVAPNPMMFSRHLKKVVRDGIVERRVLSLGPPARTQYSLTELGRDLIGPATEMLGWIDRNKDQIEASRQLHKLRNAAAPAAIDDDTSVA
jgi:DNA-binding HxlR family transcriptional regulator